MLAISAFIQSLLNNPSDFSKELIPEFAILSVETMAITRSDFIRVSGIHWRRFGSHFNIFEQGHLFVLSIDKTAAVGAPHRKALAFFFHEYFDFIDPGFIIHLQAGIEVALFIRPRRNALLERLAEVQHGFPERLSLRIPG
jgi:hypothetical protein